VLREHKLQHAAAPEATMKNTGENTTQLPRSNMPTYILLIKKEYKVFQSFLCSHDLDLDCVTLKLEYDLNSLKFYQHFKKFPG